MLHFCHFIKGYQVFLLTDHKPLYGTFHILSPDKSDRQQWQLAILTEFISDIEYVKGGQNIVADCLSQPALAVQTDACLQFTCTYWSIGIWHWNSIISGLKRFTITEDNLSVLCDTSYPRPFVRSKLRGSIFISIHSISNPGIKSSIKMIKTRYYWPNMDKAIKEFCALCTSYLQVKVYMHTKSPIQTLEIPSVRFHIVHIDMVGPLS